MAAQFSIEQYVNIAWRRKWWVLVPACIGLAVAALVIPRLPKMYEAVAVVSQDREAGQTLEGKAAQSALQTLLSKLRMEYLAAPVVRKVYALREDQPVDPRKVLAVGKALNLELSGDLIFFKASGTDPSFVAGLANAYAEQFLSAIRERKANSTGNLSAFYDKQLEDAKKALEAKEVDVSRFKALHGDSLYENIEGHQRTVDTLKDDLAAQRSELQARMDEKKTLLALLRSIQNAPVGQETKPLSLTPAQQLAQLEAELRQMRTSLGDRHPDVQKKIQQIESLRAQAASAPAAPPASEPAGEQSPDQLDPAVIGTANYDRLMTLNTEIRRLEGKIQNDLNEIARREAKISEGWRTYPEWKTLLREHEALQRKASDLQQSTQKAQITQELTTDLVGDRLLERAQVPQRPVSPDPKRILLMGLLGGIAVGAAFATLLEFLDQTYKSPEELKEAYDLPVLATITRMEEVRTVEKKYRRQRKAG